MCWMISCRMRIWSCAGSEDWIDGPSRTMSRSRLAICSRGRQLVEARQRAGQERLVLVRELRIDPVELLDVFVPDGARLGFGRGPRDPGVLFTLVGNPPAQLGGEHLLAVEIHAPVIDER